MNYAVIFAGGAGKRMSGYDIPKQFLKVEGREIIVHTLEHFENNPDIEGVVVSCKEDWIEYLKEILVKFQIRKVIDVVPGGATGQLSIYNGICRVRELSQNENDIVLIHDGVRPLINSELISKNIRLALQHGSCITCVKVTETIVRSMDTLSIEEVYDREHVYIAKAPQTFFLKDIYEAHKTAMAENKLDFIDSCTLMKAYNYPLFMLQGDYKNIKITTPIDYFMFKAILENDK